MSITVFMVCTNGETWNHVHARFTQNWSDHSNCAVSCFSCTKKQAVPLLGNNKKMFPKLIQKLFCIKGKWCSFLSICKNVHTLHKNASSTTICHSYRPQGNLKEVDFGTWFLEKKDLEFVEKHTLALKNSN